MPAASIDDLQVESWECQVGLGGGSKGKKRALRSRLYKVKTKYAIHNQFTVCAFRRFERVQTRPGSWCGMRRSGHRKVLASRALLEKMRKCDGGSPERGSSRGAQGANPQR